MLILLLTILCLLVLIYLLLIRPSLHSRQMMAPFRGVDYAHRGLWNAEIPENSLPAFIRAAQHGFGVELDVQLTVDDRLVVFHDDELDRMCPTAPRGLTIPQCTLQQLRQYPLLNTDERIPELCDVLSVLDGHSPLIAELKTAPNRARLAHLASLELKRCFTHSPYCIESFDPRIIFSLREWHLGLLTFGRRPVPLGQLSYGVKGLPANDAPSPFWPVLSSLLCNLLSRPDFIAWDHRTTSLAYRLVRRLYRPFTVAWTVRSQDDMDRLRDIYDAQIFEGFIPRGK